MDSEYLYESIGSRIKVLRKALGYTQAELAECIGKSRVSIANLESGIQKSPLGDLYCIAEFLEVNVADLLPENPPATKANHYERGFQAGLRFAITNLEALAKGEVRKRDGGSDE